MDLPKSCRKICIWPCNCNSVAHPIHILRTILHCQASKEVLHRCTIEALHICTFLLGFAGILDKIRHQTKIHQPNIWACYPCSV